MVGNKAEDFTRGDQLQAQTSKPNINNVKQDETIPIVLDITCKGTVSRHIQKVLEEVNGMNKSPKPSADRTKPAPQPMPLDTVREITGQVQPYDSLSNFLDEPATENPWNNFK